MVDQATQLRRLVLLNNAVNATALFVEDNSEGCREAIKKDVEEVLNLLPAIEGYCKVSYLLGRNPLKGLREMSISCVFGDKPAPARSPYFVRIVKEGSEVTATLEVSR